MGDRECTLSYLCNGDKEYGKIWSFFPLALFAILSGLLFFSWGIYEIVEAILSWNITTWLSYFSILVSLMRIVIGIIAIVATLCQWQAGISAMPLLTKLLLLGSVVGFIINWIFWIADIASGRQSYVSPKEMFPDKSEIVGIIVYTLFAIIFFISAWWIITCFASLAYVFDAGGTGWEGKSHLALRSRQPITRIGHVEEDSWSRNSH